VSITWLRQHVNGLSFRITIGRGSLHLGDLVVLFEHHLIATICRELLRDLEGLLVIHTIIVLLAADGPSMMLF
jgi:hypothetical protein